eukprot:TRINITY_DN107_c0_g1_i1.p2 TRINITY_DN107_c0_g1~~TRINITY_DN107_c0_g1_i1.p2  ORF type:complete len:196 (+),score=25.24 TRINITY_DN107_c0_g1_i1:77-664(+)
MCIRDRYQRRVRGPPSRDMGCAGSKSQSHMQCRKEKCLAQGEIVPPTDPAPLSTVGQRPDASVDSMPGSDQNGCGTKETAGVLRREGATLGREPVDQIGQCHDRGTTGAMGRGGGILRRGLQPVQRNGIAAGHGREPPWVLKKKALYAQRLKHKYGGMTRSAGETMVILPYTPMNMQLKWHKTGTVDYLQLPVVN